MGIPTLRLQLFVDGRRKKFKTTKPSIFLGNAKLCDIKVKLNSDKANFIEIKVENNKIYLVDKHTEDGLFLDNIKVPVKEAVLYTDQLIRIGKTTIDLNIELEGAEEFINPHELEFIKNDSHKPKKNKKLEVSLNEKELDSTDTVPSIFPLNDARNRKELFAQAKLKENSSEKIATQAQSHVKTQVRHLTQVQQKPQSVPIYTEDDQPTGHFEPSVTQAFIKELLNSEVSNTKFRVNELKEEAQSTKDKVDAKNEELHELEKEYLRLKKDARLFEYNCEELKERQAQLKAEKDELKELVKELEDKKSFIEQETAIVSSQREVASIELETYKSEKLYLQEELEEISNELKNQKDELSTFTKNMMDEYSRKKEEAISYYEAKVKEATEYFDQKEKGFKEDKKEIQAEINQRLKDCDDQIRKEKENWQIELKRHQGELELIKEKTINEANVQKDNIIREAEEQAIKIAEEMNDLAETEKKTILKEAHDQKRDILFKYESEGQMILKELTDKANIEKDQLIQDGESQKRKLVSAGEKEKQNLITDGEKQKSELIKKGILEAEKEKDIIISNAHKEKDSLIKDAHEDIERTSLEAKSKLDKELHQARLDYDKESQEKKENLKNELKEMKDIASESVAKMQQNLSQLEKDYEKLKKTLFDERTERLSELNQELESKKVEFEQEIVNKRLEFETKLSKESEKQEIKEKNRIKGNIDNVTSNIITLLSKKLEYLEYSAKEIDQMLAAKDIKEIVSDSFDVDAAVHDKKLGQFLLKSADASEKVKNFRKKLIIGSSISLLILIAFMINPDLLSDTKEVFVNSISLNKSSNDSLVEERKQAILSRPKLNPIRDGKIRESFTDSILFTAQYRELVLKKAYQKKWTIELNLHVLKDIDLSEEVVIKYMALEAPLHAELVEAFNNTYEEHKDKGIARLRDMESEVIPKMKKLFKTDKKWKEFLKFRELFFTRYRENL